MTFSQKQIDTLARLARITLTPDEERKFSDQLSSILEYVESVRKVDTTGVSAEFHLRELKGVSADDAVNPVEADSVVDVAPRTSERMIEIPPLHHE